MEPGVAAYEKNSALFHVMQKLLSNPEKMEPFFTSYFITLSPKRRRAKQQPYPFIVLTLTE
jgi:hypothetical protein